MIDRKQKIEELLTDLQALRRAMAFRAPAAAGKYRVTPSQWGVLALVEHQETCTVKDVAKALGVTSSAATQFVDGLVESGYLLREQSDEDRRRVTLSLSKKTKKQLAKIKAQMRTQFLAAFKALTDAEFAHYCALNKKIVQASLKRKNKNV